MNCVKKVFCPFGNFIFIRRVRVNAYYYLCIFCVAITPCSSIIFHTTCGTVYRVNMCTGKHCRNLRTVCYILCNCFITKVVHKICFPVPLHTRRIESIESTLQSRMRHWLYSMHQRRTEFFYRSKNFFSFICRAVVTPYHSAYGFHMQFFGKWSNGRND